jgi:hypothetical protein
MNSNEREFSQSGLRYSDSSNVRHCDQTTGGGFGMAGSAKTKGDVVEVIGYSSLGAAEWLDGSFKGLAARWLESYAA